MTKVISNMVPRKGGCHIFVREDSNIRLDEII